MATLEHDLAPVSGDVSALRQLAAGILRVLLAALRVDAILARGVPGAVARRPDPVQLTETALR